MTEQEIKSKIRIRTFLIVMFGFFGIVNLLGVLVSKTTGDTLFYGAFLVLDAWLVGGYLDDRQILTAMLKQDDSGK